MTDPEPHDPVELPVPPTTPPDGTSGPNELPPPSAPVPPPVEEGDPSL